MNPNDLIAQQQEYASQVMQNYQHWFWVAIVIQFGLMIIGGCVIYLFYARLRDIAEELMKLRVAYEFANPPKSSSQHPLTPTEQPANPFQSGGDTRHQPK